ncbi:carboxypeptidase-like regulatory domain-containing protein [Olivibacter sp. SDN3]|uniref:carboxypeptidase-like regulatory domain-containing protein n=1 Tax=Olivibacter sp. SDN3 TaxID=2764720 RepID=UPI001650DC77|nr:carboxypeptidase-like regulatory domain-containing protein [Olivibacter sp. SDN3]QNL50614.1 carboxypeptidase-like regulatory domain-containing protein [Olivibacter sp. SDN3]
MKHKKPDIEQVRKYLNGELNAREMYELERQAQDDPLLMDVMLGMESAEEQQHKQNIGTIEQLLHERIQRKNVSSNSWKVWAVAASMVFAVIGVGFWLLNKDTSLPKQQIAEQVPMQQDTAENPRKDTDRLVATAETPQVKEAPAVQKNDKEQVNRDTNEDVRNESKDRLLASRQSQTKTLRPSLSAASTKGTTANRKTAVAKGIVVDKQTNTPLMGAMVKQVGQQDGITTDATGSFELPIPADSPRVDISYIGYEQQRVDATRRDSLVIAMEPSQAELSEIVVVSGEEDSFARVSYTQDSLEEFVVGNSRPRQSKALPAIGWKAYREYLDRSAVTPSGIQTRVTLAFKIDEQGKPIAIRVVEGASEALNQKAIEILRKGSTWVKDQSSSTDELQINIIFH